MGLKKICDEIFCCFKIFVIKNIGENKFWWKIQNSNHDKTQIVRRKKIIPPIVKNLKLNWRQNTKTQWWQNSKPQTVTKPKNSNCDKFKKIKLWQIKKTQMVTKLNNSNCYNLKCFKTQKWKIKNWNVTNLKMWQNTKC